MLMMMRMLMISRSVVVVVPVLHKNVLLTVMCTESVYGF